MNSAPLTSWEGVEAYFTFADKPGVLVLLFCLALAATIVGIFLTVRHENHSYAQPTDELPHLRE